MINRKRTIVELCGDGNGECKKVIGPMRKISVDGVNIREDGYCLAWMNPGYWYRLGGCPLKPLPEKKKKSQTITGRASKKKKKNR